MASSSTFPTGTTGKHTFIYTNYCFDTETLKSFKAWTTKIIKRDTQIYISNSWSFKRMFAETNFQFSQVQDWGSAIFLNFTKEELKDHMNKVKFIAANYLNANNIELALGVNTIKCVVESPVYDIQKFIIPYNVIATRTKYETVYSIDQTSPDYGKEKLVLTNFSIDKQFEIASLKRALLNFDPKKNRFLFVMPTRKIHSLLDQLSQEQRLYQMLFSCNGNVFLNTTCDLVLDYLPEKRVELELLQLKQRKKSKKWVPFPHRLFEFSEPGVLISVGEMAGCTFSHNYLQSEHDFLIL